MTTATSNIEQITRDFYREIDANDPDVFGRHFTENAVFAFNDVDPVSSPAAISDFVAAWKGNFDAVLHDLDALTVDPDSERVAVQITVTYKFADGHDVSVKGASVVQFSGESISHWFVYVDTSRLS
ncbi:nuclear transport factor 2 family protein [Gordonia terrae]